MSKLTRSPILHKYNDYLHDVYTLFYADNHTYYYYYYYYYELKIEYQISSLTFKFPYAMEVQKSRRIFYADNYTYYYYSHCYCYYCYELKIEYQISGHPLRSNFHMPWKFKNRGGYSTLIIIHIIIILIVIVIIITTN